MNENDENSTPVEENVEGSTTVDKEVDSNDDKDIEFWKSEAEKWKELSRKNEFASKENYKKLTEYDSRFSELQKSFDETSKYKEENINLLKRAVIAETGLPLDLSSRLQGDTEEDLKKDAELLLELFGQVKKTPKPIKSQGTDATNNILNRITSKEEYMRFFTNTQ